MSTKRKSTSSHVEGRKKARFDLPKTSLVRQPSVAATRTAIGVLSRQLGIELKNIDFGIAPTAINTTAAADGLEMDPAAGALFSITQGDTSSQREGRRCTVKNIFIQGAVQFGALTDQTDPDNLPVVTIWLVMDKNTNGAQMNSEDALSQGQSNPSNGPYCLANLNRSDRFKILDRVVIDDFRTNVCFPDNAGTAQYTAAWSHAPKYFKLSWKGEAVQEYSASTGAVADITTVSFHVLAVTSTASATPQLSYSGRARFVG